MTTAPPPSRKKRTRTERRLRVRAIALGTLLTLSVLFLVAAHHLSTLEGEFYDARIRWCQFFRKPPTDRLVHVDIDDGALDTVGRWPWPRSILADVVDELSHAGVTAVAFDVTLSEVEKPVYDAAGNLTDNDAIFAAAVKRAGNILIPTSLTFEKPPVQSPPILAAESQLLHDLELAPEQLNQLLTMPLSQDEYFAARNHAVRLRIQQEIEANPTAPPDFPAIRDKLLPKWTRLHLDNNAPALQVLIEQYRKVQAERAQKIFTLPQPPNIPALHGYSLVAPLPSFAAAARYGASVDFVPEYDGKLRRVPLVAEFQGRLFPQMGLVLACAQLGVDPHSLEIAPDHVSIPLKTGNTITIPLSIQRTRYGNVGMFMDIPWFGHGDWTHMYAAPNGGHLNIGVLYELADWRRRIRANNAQIDDALKDLLQLANDWGASSKYTALKLPQDDFQARLTLIKQIVKQDMIDTIEMVRPVAAADRDKQYKTIPESYDALNSLIAQNTELSNDLQQRTSLFQTLLKDHIVLIGETASSSTDFVNTPLNAVIPGVVAHGVIVNAILIRQLWQEAPDYVNLLHTFAAGLLATLAVAILKPWQGAIAVATLLAIYLGINGLLLFDRDNYLVTTAGPVTAVLVVWAAVTLISIIAESAERARITNRFRVRVDPQLVDHHLENPHLLKIHGQVKTLTVVFTDLVGFTTITEKMREKTVDILNEYLSIMVPIIRARHGYVNKFLGDGIMIVFGAFKEDRNHAIDAVDTVLEMMKATKKFSHDLAQRGLPEVKMRAGVSTGPMVVGDAGSDTASDYTVLGDSVNTGARLEQANKRLDTEILITAKTNEMLRLPLTPSPPHPLSFLTRPVGFLLLAGKSETVETYELLAAGNDITPALKRLAHLSQTVITQITNNDPQSCRQTLDTLIAEFGPTKFTTAYTQLCQSPGPQTSINA